MKQVTKNCPFLSQKQNKVSNFVKEPFNDGLQRGLEAASVANGLKLLLMLILTLAVEQEQVEFDHTCGIKCFKNRPVVAGK